MILIFPLVQYVSIERTELHVEKCRIPIDCDELQECMLRENYTEYTEGYNGFVITSSLISMSIAC